MYNLLVSGDENAWDGAHIDFSGERCIREYTEDQIAERFAKLDAEAVASLRRFPCVFAYESGFKKPPKFGLIRKASKRQGMVRIEYEIIPLDKFIDENELAELAVELDIDKWEL